MTYIINSNAIILILAGKKVRIEKTDLRYPNVLKALTLPKEEQEDAIALLVTPISTKINQIHGQNGFEVVDDEVFYKGEKLPNALVSKVKSIIRDGLPLDHFEKFWENLEQNPTASSVTGLLEFLEYKELPITEDGCFLAYKGLQEDYWSISGNTNTKVVKGQVDSAGRIFNGVGEELEVRRRDVDDNRSHHCSFGLHVGSLAYASEFARGRIVVVKVNPKDVVSVPTDCSCQKCRVTAYTVVSDYEGEISASVVNSEGQSTLVPDANKERKSIIDRIDAYLERKRDQGEEEVSIRSIQNIFSPNYVGKEVVLDALQELHETWDSDEDGTLVVIL